MKQHMYLMRTKWFRMYWRGSYCWLEVDFGKVGEGEFVLFFGTYRRDLPWLQTKWYKI